MGISLTIGTINFCLMHKFCQRYDENVEDFVGGFSVCDIFTCLLTCGLAFRKPHDDEVTELDFRKRFEKSMDKGGAVFGEKKTEKRERKIKNVDMYQSEHSKNAKNGGEEDGEKRGKCYECCCIIFCCKDSNMYQGEEKQQRGR